MIIFNASYDAFFVGDRMILIMPDNYDQIIENVNLYDGLILSIEKYSVNVRYQINLDEIKRICKDFHDKDIFVSINKNIENEEIEEVENILLELNNCNIKGVFYSDVSIVTYKDKLNYELVWAQEHLVTNYETINYWKQFGVNYAYLSSDITKDEMISIKNNTKVNLICNLFGYTSMFVSKRHIVNNYLDKFSINNKSKLFFLKKEGKEYPIVDKNYTSAFSNNIFNGIKEYYNINPSYYVCNGFLIENTKFSKVLSLIGNINVNNVEKIYDDVNKMFDNIDTGFLYNETISKVKK